MVVADGKILPARRNHEPFYDHWCIPGGHIEFGRIVADYLTRRG